MTEEQLKEWLKEHLRIEVNHWNDWYDRGFEVRLTLDGQEISSSTFCLDSGNKGL